MAIGFRRVGESPSRVYDALGLGLGFVFFLILENGFWISKTRIEAAFVRHAISESNES